MPRAEIEKTFGVSSQSLWKTVTAYKDYPQFVEGVKQVHVEGNQVTYTVSLMKEVTYTLKHTEDAAALKMTWELVESDFFKVNRGGWEIQPGEATCRAKYWLEVEFGFMVPGFVVKKLIQGQLPKMIENFESRARL